MEIGSLTTEFTEKSQPENSLEQAGLDRDAFLKLFMAQLENQDPLSPQDPAELASQLAQFSQFEQSLRMVAELQSINQRLDQLIESSQSQAASGVDPLSLLGREVEFQGDTVRVPASGTTSALRFEVSEISQSIGMVVRDELGQPIGQVLLEPTSQAFLSAGSYGVEVSGENARLRTPSGSTEDLPLVRIETTDNGSIQKVLDSDGNPEPFSFEPGRTYQFAIGATTQDGYLIDLDTTTTGTVESVRNTTGTPVVVVHGEEMDLSKLIRIR